MHETPTQNFDDTGPTTLEEFQVQMEGRRRDELTFGIAVGGEPVGACGAVIATDGRRACWRGLCVARSRWRQGIASEALRLMYRDLASRGVTRISAFIFADNLSVRRLFEQFDAEHVPCDVVTTRHGQSVRVLRLDMPTAKGVV